MTVVVLPLRRLPRINLIVRDIQKTVADYPASVPAVNDIQTGDDEDDGSDPDSDSRDGESVFTAMTFRLIN